VITRSSCFIGKSNLPADPLLQADLAALIVFDKELTPTDRQAVEGYLKKKWAY